MSGTTPTAAAGGGLPTAWGPPVGDGTRPVWGGRGPAIRPVADVAGTARSGLGVQVAPTPDPAPTSPDPAAGRQRPARRPKPRRRDIALRAVVWSGAAAAIVVPGVALTNLAIGLDHPPETVYANPARVEAWRACTVRAGAAHDVEAWAQCTYQDSPPSAQGCARSTISAVDACMDTKFPGWSKPAHWFDGNPNPGWGGGEPSFVAAGLGVAGAIGAVGYGAHLALRRRLTTGGAS